MPARVLDGKGSDRLARPSLSGRQYCVAIRDKLLGDSTIEDALLRAMRDLCALPPLGGGPPVIIRLRLGTTGFATFSELKGVRSAGRVSQATYASRAGPWPCPKISAAPCRLEQPSPSGRPTSRGRAGAAAASALPLSGAASLQPCHAIAAQDENAILWHRQLRHDRRV